MFSDFSKGSKACGSMTACFIIAQNTRIYIQKVYSQIAYYVFTIVNYLLNEA